MKQEILRLDNIGKISNQAMSCCISFSLYLGETLCVFTDDIPTKLFLLNLFQGSIHPDFGSLYISDQSCIIESVDCAHARGLYYVCENQLVPTMNVAHNLFMTDDRFYHFLILNNNAVHESAASLLKEFSLTHIHTKASVASLSALDQYLVSILHAVAAGARIIVLDYSCCNLIQPIEIRKMQNFINLLKEKSISILCFSSDWKVIFQSFNRFAVIQHGVVTQISNLTHIPPALPIHNHPYFPHTCHNPVERTVVLECKNYQYGQSDKSLFLNFSLQKGEILGIHDSKDLLITSLHPFCQNPPAKLESVLLNGKPYTAPTCTKRKIVFLHNGYNGNRIFLNMNLYDNIGLLLGKPQYNLIGYRNTRIRNHIVNTALKKLHAEDLIQKYGTKHTLYGMNSKEQYIVEIARWLCIHPEVFVFLVPYNAYENLSEFRLKDLLETLQKSGSSILVISCDQKILTKFCTRVICPSDI